MHFLEFVFIQVIITILVFITHAIAFIGHGVSMYDPTCAFACRDSIASYQLSCSIDEPDHSGHHDHSLWTTTPECRANDVPFLTTLAWCINTHCAMEQETWKLEMYWRERTTGNVSVLPSLTWQESVSLVTNSTAPNTVIAEGMTLNFTALTNEETWDATTRTLAQFERQETLHSRYGIVCLTVGFFGPFAISLLRFIPRLHRVLNKFAAYIVYPSIIGTYSARPLPYLLGNAPTAGQALWIFVLILVNVVLCAVGYQSTQSNTWYTSKRFEISGYLANRTGVLSFANLPLVILYAGRNNVLLYITNWSHSTFMLIHRWISRICTVQAIIHSLIYLWYYVAEGEHSMESKKPYWIWGVVATLAMSIMLVISTLWFRRQSYEIFLLIHILLSVFALVGGWYHVDILFERKWGYELWFYAAFAVWGVDRFMRIYRMVRTGVRSARLESVPGGIIKVEIMVNADLPEWVNIVGKHAYLYFPTISWRTWENHPFSVASSRLTASPYKKHVSSRSESTSSTEAGKVDGDQQIPATTPHVLANITSEKRRIVFYVKKENGLTSILHNKSSATVPLLLEGPYGHVATPAVCYDCLVLIAGGIGITAILPYIHSHPNVKLYWSLSEKSRALVDFVADEMAGIEKEISVGKRFNLGDIIQCISVSGKCDEQGHKWGFGVVVCGPPGMCDDVRSIVVHESKHRRTPIGLEVEAFAW